MGQGQFAGFLLRDEFTTDRAAGAINGTATEPGGPWGIGARTVRDAESKITTASGWLNFAAQATAVYSEEDIVWANKPITRAPGKVIVAKWKCTTDGPQYPLALVISTTPTWNHTHVEAAFWRSSATTLSIVSNATVGPSFGSFVADGTVYKLAIVLQTTGARFYIKGGTYTYWTKVYQIDTGSTATLYVAAAGNTAVFATTFYRNPITQWLDAPLGYDLFTTAGTTSGYGGDGLYGAGGAGKSWLTGAGATWSVSTGKAVNTPSLGEEKISDPGLEGTYTAGLCAQLSKGGTPTVAQSANVHGGTKAQEFTAIAMNDRLYVAPTTAVGTWYRMSIWAKRTAGAAGTANVRFGGTGISTTRSIPITTADYTQHIFVGRCTVDNNVVLYPSIELGTAFDTVIIDDLSLKALNTPDLFQVSLYDTPNVRLGVEIWYTVGLQAGLVFNLDSPTNPQYFILAYLDGAGNVKVDECVAGVYTNKASTAVTYVAGARLMATKESATTIRVFYNNIAVGSIVTVTSNNNLYHGIFDTGNPTENQLDTFRCDPYGSENQFAFLDLFL